MTENQRALAGFHGEASAGLLERGKASRLLELTTAFVAEKLEAKSSVQKRQIFRAGSRNSDRFWVAPSRRLSPSSSDPLESVLNDVLSELKNDVDVVGSLPDDSSNLTVVIKTLNKAAGAECRDEESSAPCDASEPHRYRLLTHLYLNS